MSGYLCIFLVRDSKSVRINDFRNKGVKKIQQIRVKN